MKTTQRDNLFQLFESRPGQWIPLPEILRLGIAQYGARIYDLRKEGKEIQNKTIEVVDGQKRTAFMYVRKEKQIEMAI